MGKRLEVGEGYEQDDPGMYVFDESGIVVLVPDEREIPPTPERVALLKRMVACYNACDGIPTERLVDGVIPRFES